METNLASWQIYVHCDYFNYYAVVYHFLSVQQDVLSRKRNRLVKKSKTAKASASSQRLEAELSFLNEQATGE